MDLPGSKIPPENVICPLAVQMGSFPQGNYQGDYEFDNLEIAKILLKKKYFILATALIAAIVGVVYALSLPNIYKSEVLVIPGKRFEGSKGGGLSSLANQFGGLASVIGMNLGGGMGPQNESEVYLAVMRTRPFAEYTIREFRLMPFLTAEGNERKLAEDKLDDAVKILLDGMKIEKATKEVGSGLRISFVSKSPEFSAKMVETLVKSINRYSQSDTIERAKKDVEMAKIQLQQTPVALMQKALWDIIAQKTMEIILAQAQDDFSFRTIEPAVIPKRKVKPSRGVIVVGFTSLGFLIGTVGVLLWTRPSFLKKSS